MPTIPQNQPTPVPSGLDPTVLNLAKAIRDQESQGNYGARGKAGEIGAYQFMPSTWNSIAPKYNVTTPLENSTPQEQNAVAYNYILDLKNKGLNPMQVAAAWNAGEKKAIDGTWQTNVASDGSFNTPAYAQSVYQKYQSYKGQDIQQEQPINTLPDYGATFPYTPSDNGFVAGFKALGNLPSSAYGFASGIASLALHPVQSARGIGSAVIGGVENLTGENKGNPDQYQQVANAVGKALIDRYGSLDALTNTATNDPFGFGADVASLIAGGAGLAGKSAELSDLTSRAASTVTKPIANAVEKVVSPLKTIIGAPDTGVIDAAARQGVTLNAGATTQSPIVRSLEALSATGLGSEQHAATIERAASQLDTAAQRIIKSANGAEDLTSAGEVIAKGVQSYEKAFKKAYEDGWKPIETAIGDKQPTSIENTVNTLKTMVSDYTARGLTSDARYFQTKLDAVLGKTGEGNLTLKRLKQIRGDVDSDVNYDRMAKQGLTADKVDIKRVADAMRSDIEKTISTLAGENAASAFRAINAKYAAGMKEIGMSYVKKIRTLSSNGEYEKIASSIVSPAFPIEDIPRLLNVIGHEGVNNLRAGLMSKIIRNASKSDAEGGGFTPQGILTAIKKFNSADGKNKLREILTKEQFQGLQDIGKVTKAIADSQKALGGSQTAFLLKTMAETGAIGTGIYQIATGDFLSGAQKIAGVIGAEGFSYFIASPTGQRILKLFITRGTELSTEGAKIGLPTQENNGINNTNGLPVSARAGMGNIPTNGNDIPVTPNALGEGKQIGNTNVGNNTTVSPTPSRFDSASLTELKKLARDKGFDLNAARKAGYSDVGIKSFLENLKQETQVSPAKTSVVNTEKSTKSLEVNTTQSLINEAKKYKSAEEFVKSSINDLNPIGGVFVEHNPSVLSTAPLGENMTTLDKTFGGKPTDTIMVYRGTPGKEIVPGDFITTNKQLAKDYAGNANVVELMVKKGDILDDKMEPLGEEYIYRPGAYNEKTLSKSQLTDIWNKAHGK